MNTPEKYEYTKENGKSNCKSEWKFAFKKSLRNIFGPIKRIREVKSKEAIKSYTKITA